MSRGVTVRMPAMAAKDSCRLTEAAAKGFFRRMSARAAARAVDPSLSRRNKGAAT